MVLHANFVFTHFLIFFGVVKSQLVDVYNFGPSDNTYQKNSAKIFLPNNTHYEQGFTICLRVKFSTWNPKCLVQTESFEVTTYSYKNFDGFEVSIFGNLKEYSWVNPLNYFDEWQSFCFIYDAKQSNFQVSLNGVFQSSTEVAFSKSRGISFGSYLKVN